MNVQLLDCTAVAQNSTHSLTIEHESKDDSISSISSLTPQEGPHYHDRAEAPLAVCVCVRQDRETCCCTAQIVHRTLHVCAPLYCKLTLLFSKLTVHSFFSPLTMGFKVFIFYLYMFFFLFFYSINLNYIHWLLALVLVK